MEIARPSQQGSGLDAQVLSLLQSSRDHPPVGLAGLAVGADQGAGESGHVEEAAGGGGGGDDCAGGVAGSGGGGDWGGGGGEVVVEVKTMVVVV